MYRCIVYVNWLFMLNNINFQFFRYRLTLLYLSSASRQLQLLVCKFLYVLCVCFRWFSSVNLFSHPAKLVYYLWMHFHFPPHMVGSHACMGAQSLTFMFFQLWRTTRIGMHYGDNWEEWVGRLFKVEL